MRKLLLNSSAIAVASVVATPAISAEWDVRVGGYYNAMVAYATTDGNGVAGSDFDGLDVSTNTEIFFLPSITLDNGIKIGANIQLEGETDGDQIDESYLSVKGSFGEVLLGSENSAGYKMTVVAPDASLNVLNSPSTSDYIAWSGGVDSVFRGTLGTTFLEVGRNNDAKRITYFTPRFAGFQLGVSYAHDGNEDNFGPTNIAGGSGNLGHIFDIGANFVRSFGAFNVALSGRYGIGQANIAAGPDTPTVYAFGVNLGYAGFTLGGSFAEANEHNAGVDDGIAYDAGVSYATGPWTFSMTYFHGENGEIGGTSDEQDSFGAAVDYKLAKGVRLNMFGAYVDLDAGAGPASDIDGWVIGTGIGLSF